MLNSCRNVFTGSRGGQGQTSPCENTHGLRLCYTQAHNQKLKDAKRLVMGTFYGVLISKLGYRRLSALQHVISTPFIFNSDYLRVSTSNLIGE